MEPGIPITQLRQRINLIDQEDQLWRDKQLFHYDVLRCSTTDISTARVSNGTNLP